jgi:hypothetical protein
MLKQNKQNNKSTKVNNIDQVKLEFNSDDLDENENKIIDQSKKRQLTIDKTDTTVMATPKKNAIDIIKAKIQKTPVQSYQKKSGVILTKIVQQDNTVGVVVEGAYLARAFLLGQINSDYLKLLAQQSKTDLHLLNIRGKFWTKQRVTQVLPSSINLNDVDYLISKTTKEAGSGAVLLFTAFQLLETNPEADFKIEVYKKIKAYFNETKMPPNNESSINGFITSVEQAKQLWNDWSPWTITEDIYELTTETQVDAFLEIAEKNKL